MDLLIALQVYLTLLEIHELADWLHSAPINHDDLSILFNKVHNSPSHSELARGELIQNHISLHINVLAFFNLNEVVKGTFDIVFINEGDDFIEDLEVFIYCFGNFGGLMPLK